MSLAIAIGQIGFGFGSAVAGLTYIRYGYLSNTIIGAVCIVLMGVLVRYFLPEPQAEHVH
jgi:predicted MFS family arabinose efflux permease